MAPHHHETPELLAPAGGRAALTAAIANGADAVYLGVDKFNARRGAENFTLESLAEACRYAHVRGVRVYLTLNVVILPAEIDEAIELVDQSWAAGIDAVIVQDLGLLGAVTRWLPHVRVHSSTQVNAHNTPTIRALGALGVSRVTLAREVSLDEISGLVSAAPIEVESFVHGALCVCYSGQCLMSSVIGGRSANRGQCAQPCRMTYELVDGSGAVLVTPGAHLLSPKDLAAVGALPRLIATGVAALKIEGRMKNPEYVALVTGVYRAALDRAVDDPESYRVRDGEEAVLAESFSRGFSEAYLVGERGNEMMSYQRPNNRGVLVGRVVSAETGAATIALEVQLEAEDTIEFWTSSGRFAQAVGALLFDGAEHSAAPAGLQVKVRTEQSATRGDRVFRVRNASLSAAARRSFERPGDVASVALDFTVRVVVGEPLRATVTDDRGRSATAEGSLVEPARTKAVAADEIAEHIGRLGGTHYRIGRFDLELSPGAGVGFSALHALRREALEAYENVLLAPWSARTITRPGVRRPSGGGAPTKCPDLVAEASDLDTALACLNAGADRVHVPTHVLTPGAVPDGVVPLIPRVLHDREMSAALRFASADATVAVGNLGLVGPAAQAGAKVEAHWSLNVLNAFTAEQLGEMGARFVWLSPELSGRQIAEARGATSVPLGIAVWGRQEVMVTEHCVLMAEGPCDQRCGGCDRRGAARMLRDRKGYEFPITTDLTGRTHVFNSVRLDLTAALPEIIASGVAALRLDVHTESPCDAATAVRAVRSARDAVVAGHQPGERLRSGTTSGHFFRGLA